MRRTTRLAPQRRPGLQTFRGALQRLTMTLMLVMLTTVTAWADNVMYVIAEELSGTVSISQTDANESSSYFSANKIKLTFYYGERPTGYTEGGDVWSQKTASIGSSCIFDVPTTSDTRPAWIVSTSGANLARRNEAVVQVAFDASFAAARPKYTYGWFWSMKNLNSDGIDFTNLDTRNTTNMRFMFSECMSLTSLELCSWNVAKVTDMRNMFNNCSNLTSLNILNWNVAKLNSTACMFKGCSNLAKIYCEGNWNTNTLTSSKDMFEDCTKLPGYPSNPTNSDKNKNKAKPQSDGGYFSTIGLTWNATGGYHEINDAQDLIDFATYVDACPMYHCAGMTFKLTADLDFTNMPTRSVNGNSGNFHPIGLVEDGSFDGCFSGHFDGQNHTIKALRYTNKLTSNSNNNEPVGLFKCVDGSSAVVERVILIDPQMSGKPSGCGGIAGVIYNGATIRNCTVLGGSIVHNGGKSGGIVGANSSGGAATIEGCTVIGTSVQDGMIIGYGNSQQTIKDCIYYDPNGNGIAENGYTDGGGNQRVYQLTLGEDVTASGATYSNALLPGKAYYATDATVTLGHGDAPTGYTFGGYTVTKDGTDPAETVDVTENAGVYTLSMPTNDITVTATWLPLSGNCGTTGSESSVTWSYDVTTKVLTISGTGQMMYYGSAQGSDSKYHSTAPWSHLDSEIETVTVGSGVTYIGSYAFAYCTALTSVSLPASVIALGDYVCYSSNVTRIDISNATAAATLGTGGFDYTPVGLAIAVPANLLGDYQGATNWSGYTAKLVGVLSETTGFGTTFATGNYEYQRTFKCGTAATLCLPFAVASGQISPYGKVYTFDGVDKTTEPKWTVVMREDDPSKRVTTDLVANTPYLFVPYILDGKSKGDAMPITFTGEVTTAENAGYESWIEGAGAYWTFQGVYYNLAWNEGDANLGKIYGFAAQSYDGGSYTVSPGDFVKAMAGASIKPFRAFLQYTPAPSNAPHRAGADELPSSMTVRLIDTNGEVTAIGNLDTRTGEIDFGNSWFTLDGRKLEAKPTQKGLFIYNGKKVIIK